MDGLKCFCTIGRGSKKFAIADLQLKFSSDMLITDEMEGKLFFEIDDVNINRLRYLKCVERIFFLLLYEPKITFSNKSDTYKLLSAVKNISTFQQYSRYLEQLHMDKLDINVGEPVTKRTKMNNDNNAITFRVSCKSSNKYINIKDMSRNIGSIIKQQTDWIIDLKKPEIEVVVHINHSGTVIGIPVFQKPLADRSYIKYSGLRSTIAWILASLASIQTGDVVIDPMCGNCIIPIEASKEWKSARYLASDISQEAIEKSFFNLTNAEETRAVDLFKADVTELPLTDSSVDKILCDLPFGNKHGEFENMKQMYPKIIKSMDRILKTGGQAVLLTSAALKSELIGICTIDALCEDNKDNRQNRNNCVAEKSIKQVEVNAPCKSNQDYGNIYEKCTVKIDDLSQSDKFKVKEVEDLGKLEDYKCNSFVNWTLNSKHYLKLGEMHSFACVFTKSPTLTKNKDGIC